MKEMGTNGMKAIEQAQHLLEEWRTHGRPGRFIPKEVWLHATKAAEKQGVNKTARALRINYKDLKRRMADTPLPPTHQKLGRFVELPNPDFSMGPECLVEYEKRRELTVLRVAMRGRGTGEAVSVISAILAGGNR